jgi:hypothetical protein
VVKTILYRSQAKIVKFHTQKQIGKSEDMENIRLCIFQYLTLYYITKLYTLKTGVFNYTPRCVLLHTKVCFITHQGVYILHTFLHSFRKHAIVC